MSQQVMSPVAPPVGSADSNNVEILNDIKIAMAKGYKFIKLTHHVDSLVTERVYPVDGVTVTKHFDGKTKTIRRNCQEKSGEGCMFVPDVLTGIREAYLLDTPHNRQFLASHMLENRWAIQDAAIEAEIKVIADAMPITVDTSKMSQTASRQSVIRQADVLKTMSPKQIEDQIKAKEDELKKLKELKTEDIAHKTEAEKMTDKYRAMVPENVRDKCVKMVHAKYSVDIANLKADFGHAFEKSDDYQKRIQPEIDALMLQEMGAAQSASA